MAVSITIEVNPECYLRDPLQTSLGKRIIEHSIEVLAEAGFEAFNFKQLARSMGSTEASIYRYFRNKHYLLIYLTSWYWDYMKYLIQIDIRTTVDHYERLIRAMSTVVSAASESDSVQFVHQKMLHKIVLENYGKAYHTKDVDQENSAGLFQNYKEVSNLIADLIAGVRSDFTYPHALATNLLTMAHEHYYYAEHLPSLTEIQRDSIPAEIEQMLHYYVEQILVR